VQGRRLLLVDLGGAAWPGLAAALRAEGALLGPGEPALAGAAEPVAVPPAERLAAAATALGSVEGLILCSGDDVAGPAALAARCADLVAWASACVAAPEGPRRLVLVQASGRPRGIWGSATRAALEALLRRLGVDSAQHCSMVALRAAAEAPSPALLATLRYLLGPGGHVTACTLPLEPRGEPE